MVSRVGFRGYVLEEVLAFLIRNAGYRLLVDPSQGEQLAYGRNGLVVVGRGGAHQVDVLGQLSWVPVFTFPIRLFVEAKILWPNAHRHSSGTECDRRRGGSQPVLCAVVTVNGSSVTALQLSVCAVLDLWVY